MQQVPGTKTVSRRKINVQISQREESTCNEFHEEKSARIKFHEQRQNVKSSMNKISIYDEKHQCTLFTKRIINMQQVLRTKVRTQQVYEQNQHATSSINKISFTMRKINMKQVSGTKISTKQAPRTKSVSRGEKTSVHVSRRYKLTCNNFQVQKSTRNKLHEQK